MRRRGRITFEYVLLEGVNDTAADARRLVALLHGLKAKVNLLPLNAAPAIPFSRPSDARVNEFARILADKGVRVSVRLLLQSRLPPTITGLLGSSRPAPLP